MISATRFLTYRRTDIDATGKKSGNGEESVEHRVRRVAQLGVLGTTDCAGISAQAIQRRVKMESKRKEDLLVTYPAPRPPTAENMPTEQKHTKPTTTTCVHGELSIEHTVRVSSR